MINLIKKDLLIQKKSFIMLFFFSLFMFVIYSNPIFEDFIYIMGIVLIVYIFLISANTEDEKNKSEVMLNSLPVTRKDIVLAKYISIIVYLVIGLGSLGAMALVFRLPIIPLTPRLLNGTDLLASILLVFLAVAVYFPLYFKFGAAALRIFTILLFLSFFFIPRMVVEYYMEHPEAPVFQFLQHLLEQPLFVPAAMILIFIFIIITVSYFISKKVYLQKEF